MWKTYSESYGKGNCHVCNYITKTNTFTTKAREEVLKIENGPLNCNTEKVIYLLSN